MTFDSKYQLWLESSLEIFNEKYGDTFGIKKLESEVDCESVEFSDSGSAYPHGIGGTNYIPNCVPKFEESK